MLLRIEGPEENNEPVSVDEHTSKVVKASTDLRKPSTTIRYCHGEGDWLQGDVFSAAGKKITCNRHLINIKTHHEKAAQCINL